MRTIDEIRYRNFMALFSQFRAAHAHLPDRGMVRLFAEQIGVSDRYTSHIKCARKAIGNEIARHIEGRLKLTEGWMDHDHDASKMPPAVKGEISEEAFVEFARAWYRTAPAQARRRLMAMIRESLEK